MGHAATSGEDRINLEIERVANLMLHDGISVDEQDPDKLGSYARRVDLDACNIVSTDENRDEKVMGIVYEALLYRKLKSSNAGSNMLDRGSEFGAGFS